MLRESQVMSMVGLSIATINVHFYLTGWGQTEDGFTSDVLQETMVGLKHFNLND